MSGPPNEPAAPIGDGVAGNAKPAVYAPTESHVPVLLFLFFAFVYFALRSNHHYFDSVHYARISESADNLFWQKHILHHAAVRWLWLLLGDVGVSSSTLRVAQGLNALAGAAAAAFTYLALRRACGLTIAGVAAIVLGFSGVVARHAIEGEVHTLPLFLLSLTVWLVVRFRASARSAVGIGLVAALAIVMHQAYVVFVPAVVASFASKGARRGAIATLLTFVVLPCALVYLAVFARAGVGWERFPDWLLNEAGFVGWRWESFPNAGVALLDALSPTGNRPPPIRVDTVLPALVVVALIVEAVRRHRPGARPLLWFSGWATSIGIPAIAWHHPDFQYFSPIVLAVLLPAAVGLAAQPRRPAIALALPVAALYAAASFWFVLSPAHDAATNDALSRARFVLEQASRRDVVLSTGTAQATGDLHYLPYFAKTKAVTLWQARSQFGDDHLLEGFRRLVNETATPGGRVLAFADLVTPGRSFRGFLDVPLPLDGGALRSALEEDYEIVSLATYHGSGYEEALVELRPRRAESPAEGRPCGLGCPFGYQCVGGSCQCGPAPHFQLRESRCLPSCGVLVNEQLARPETVACCEAPCAPDAAFATGEWETWDCRFCCGGRPEQALCTGTSR